MDLNLFPLTTTLSPAGALQIAGLDLHSLADQYGTPLYLYDAATIQNQVNTLQALLKQLYPAESEVSYASKAYLSLGMAQKLAGLGVGLDAVSLGELKIAARAGFLPGRVHLHGNNKLESELRFAVEWGIHSIVVDGLDELSFLENLACRMNKTVRIWLRLTPGISVNTHAHIQTAHSASKFGLLIEGGQAVEAVRIARKSSHVQLAGLHFHLGSQLFDPQPYHAALLALLKLGADENFTPLEISTGGGWGVPYTAAMPSGAPSPWISTLSTTLQEFCAKHSMPLPRLIIEPGRWLVARAGLALYTIGSTKFSASGICMAAVDGGMADNPRPALYQSTYTACLVDRPGAEPSLPTAVVGKYCESGDVLIPQISLPALKRGDLLAIPVSGAYQLSMASNYNLAPRPAVLWLENGRIEILQPRENPEESLWWTNGSQDELTHL